MTENELLELLMAFLPETLEGALALGVIICAILAIALPKPPEEAHPLIRAGHRLICVLGLGAAKLRAAGKIGKLARLLRPKQ